MKKPVGNTIIFHLSIPGKLAERIDAFTFEQRFATRAAAMRYLMTWALDREAAHRPPG